MVLKVQSPTQQEIGSAITSGKVQKVEGQQPKFVTKSQFAGAYQKAKEISPNLSMMDFARQHETQGIEVEGMSEVRKQIAQKKYENDMQTKKRRTYFGMVGDVIDSRYKNTKEQFGRTKQLLSEPLEGTGAEQYKQLEGQKFSALTSLATPLGQTAGAIGDIAFNSIGRTIKAITPDVIENKVKEGAKDMWESVKDKQFTQDAMQVLNKGVTEASIWAEENSDEAMMLDNVFGFMDIIGAGYAVKGAKRGIEKGATQVIDKSIDMVKKMDVPVIKIPESPLKGVSEQMLANMNRISKGKQKKFAQVTGETVGEFLNNRGIIEGGEDALEKLGQGFMKYKSMADEGLASIEGNYKFSPVSYTNKYGDELVYEGDAMLDMLEDAVDFATVRKDPNRQWLDNLLNKYSNTGISQTEVNKVKRFYERNNKLAYGKDMTAGAKTELSTNIDNAVRQWQFKVAEDAGFADLAKINKETQAYKLLLDELTAEKVGIMGNNMMGLTDWIAAGSVAIEPTALSMFVGKKIFDADWFRTQVVKIINKINGHETVTEKLLDLEKIQNINTKKQLDEWLNTKYERKQVERPYIPENETFTETLSTNIPDGNTTILPDMSVPEPKAQVTKVADNLTNEGAISKIDSTLSSTDNMLDSVNPTGSVFTEYNPAARATAQLSDNITTLDKTMGKSPDEVIKIYRGTISSQKEIVPGDFITTNKQLAKDYAGNGVVIEKEVKLSDILDDIDEPLGEEYIYRPQ